MITEFTLLLLTAMSVAFIHTLSGPDHYLPFIMIAKARNWSLAKTSWFTFLCGLGHVGSSVVLGFIGIAFSIGLSNLELFESVRGSMISWLFTAFGLVYLVWAIYRILRGKKHTHIHYHDSGNKHVHEHSHQSDHMHVHDEKTKTNITPWILFTLFVFGPCEPLIPLLMYPASEQSKFGTVIVAVVFSVVTISTMLVMVLLPLSGLKLLPMKFLHRYMHAIAGATILLCGISIEFMGL